MLLSSVVPSKARRLSRATSGGVAFALLVGLLGGCSAPANGERSVVVVDDHEGSETRAQAPTWEQFRKYAEKNSRTVNGQTVFIVEWDIPMTESQLHDYYVAHFVDVNKSTVDVLTSGADNVWTGFKELALTYCVSTDFGPAGHARMQSEMAQATLAWTRAANITFFYRSAEDANCNDANPAVVIPVVPFNGGGACSFFPNQDGRPACTEAGRALVINIGDIDAWPTTPIDGVIYPNLSTLGTLRHELGHIIGLRHEQIREADDAVANCVGEVTNPGPYRALTAYDRGSVMQYPWCNGVITSAQQVTYLDGVGVRSLYGIPASWHSAF